MPMLGRSYWPLCLNMMQRYGLSTGDLFLWFSLIVLNAIHILAYLFFWICHRYEFSFIERYKAVEGDWPWYQDAKGWPSFRNRSLALFVLNSFVVVPAWAYFALWTTGNLKCSTRMEDLPSELVFAL